MVKKIDAAEFHELLKRDEPVVVKLGAGWCNDCTAQTVQLNELGEEVFEIDTDKEFELSVSLGVKALPKIKVFKSGQLVREYTGVFNTTADARFFVKNTNSDNV